MSQYASTSIPKPKNWQDFENHTCILFQCILSDPNTVAHGRTGQAQHGVDVYGRRRPNPHHWVGIQCKQKGDSQELTKEELRKEVAAAKKFRPPLSEFIVVTTAADDAKIQRIAREITQQHEKDGLFSVEVWGWETLEREINKHPEAIDAFHPDLTPFTRKLESLSEENLDINKQHSDKLDSIHDSLHALFQQMAISQPSVGESSVDTSSAAREAVEETVHREIDGYRDLLREGKPNTAKSLLNSLRERVWESASNRVRFRITTNIGAAHLEAGNEQSAADAFLKALDYDPDDRVGLANVALAYLIRKEPENAVAQAQRALAHDPENAAAAAHLISGCIADVRVSDPFSVVPEPLHDTPEVLASAINFLCQRHNADWRRLAREAAETHKDEKQLQRQAAEAVLDEALSSDHIGIGGAPRSEGTVEDVRRAASVLQSLWEEARKAEGERPDSALPHNLALALWAVNEFQAAAAVLDQALERYADDESIRQLRAALYFQAGEQEAGWALIRNHAGPPGMLIMQAQALVNSEPQRARAVIQGTDFSAAPLHQRLAAEQLVIEAYVNEGSLDQALACAEALVEGHPGSIAALVELAHIQRMRGSPDADAILTRALDALSDESPFAERLTLAEALDDAGRYEDVVTVLHGHVDVGHDSAALRLMLFSYIHADRRAAAGGLLARLPAEVASQPPYLKALAGVNANRKDFPAAREALDRYLALKPEDLAMRLRWLQFCHRLDERDRIEAYLSGDVEEIPGPPHLRMELAHWLNHFGFDQRALRLAYSVFLYNSTSPDVHLGYMRLLLPPGPTASISPDFKIIDNNVAFEVDHGDGSRSWFIIEPDAYLRKDETYISPESEITQKVRGAAPGATIEWGEKRATWTVVTIKSKYLHALHRSLENFERHFPTAEGLRQVKIDTGASEPFKELFDSLKERHDHVHRVFDILEQKLIPIHMAAGALGVDIIEARNGLQETGRNHRVCAGTHPERIQAIEALRRNEGRGCVIDALTLKLIRGLGIEDAVRRVCGPICVTGSTRDVYWRRVKEMEDGDGPSVTLYWQDGQCVRHELSQEEWNSALQAREADLQWIDEHTTIIPAESATDPPVDLRGINELIGNDFIDDMWAAHGSENLLLCQDQVYRLLAKKYLGVAGSWIQPLLMIARDEKSLSRKEYNEAVMHLVELGDRFISIDPDVLIAAARDEANPVRRFDRVAGQLGGAEADISSHIIVAAKFLDAVWSEQRHALTTKKQTSILLENLIRARRDWRDIIGALRWVFGWRFGHNAELDNYILLWLQGHFLVPFGSRKNPLDGQG
ncbi:tetratricopeptide repeat protein [Arhodomonas aquaeolei]|uniref:tetratricopeptide repeat protein n=1 Tax=Arhodomonas aquaeolei TaxID=2369 RepID=UPI0003A070D8|nr:hypothetical protein [Arhodomonas aquaeolei]